uniref:NADH-ubiquinone oxidoreductase chain 2 n=1 Tax=Pedetontus silvestrii TaxID=518099 RepID=B7SSK3_9INSE|nr:NADH dehydrogenase subunit 2 [Pedetontus silvestrii]ACC60215.1 NADH dehydrogenase subunit 2 [Pedetontus silvestrii]
MLIPKNFYFSSHYSEVPYYQSHQHLDLCMMGLSLISFLSSTMSNGMNQRSTEASLKYFLTQALGSTVLILSVIYLFYSLKFMNFTSVNKAALALINTSLLLKMGAAPLHMWFPMVMQGLSWFNSFILMTWQKFAPLVLLSYNMNMSMKLITMSIFLSAIMGAIGGLNQTMLRKLMAFSAINHLSWIMAAMSISESTWLMYYMMYVLLSTTVIMFFMLNNIFHINQIYSAFNMNKLNKLTFSLNLMSLGGLPPFLGFFPKWIVLQNFLEKGNILIIFIMIMSTLITLFYYLRVTYLNLLMLHSMKMWMMPFIPLTMYQMISISLNIFSILSFPALINVLITN